MADPHAHNTAARPSNFPMSPSSYRQVPTGSIYVLQGTYTMVARPREVLKCVPHHDLLVQSDMIHPIFNIEFSFLALLEGALKSYCQSVHHFGPNMSQKLLLRFLWNLLSLLKCYPKNANIFRNS